MVLAVVMGNLALPALAGGACMDFKWDVSRERALFAGTATAVTAGTDPKSAPVIVPDRLYALRLAAQDHVKFAVAPANKSAGTAAYAGLATLKLPSQGSYRIAVDLPFWIDVVSNGTLVSAEDFQGQHECGAPHKIVVFALGGAQPLVLQLSAAAQGRVLLTVTAAPARKL
ncbi:MAG: hypothetical protein ACYDBZ_06380 [Steroidobacteraceae bacterium]